MCIGTILWWFVGDRTEQAIQSALSEIPKPYCTDSLDAEKRYIPHEYSFAVSEKELSTKQKIRRLKEAMPWEEPISVQHK